MRAPIRLMLLCIMLAPILPAVQSQPLYQFPYREYQGACLEAMYSEPDFVFFNPAWVAKHKVTQILETSYTKPVKGKLILERKLEFDANGMLKSMYQKLDYLGQKHWEPLCQCTTRMVGPLTELRCYYLSHFYEKIMDTVWTRVHYYHPHHTRYVLLTDSVSTMVYDYDDEGRLAGINRNGEYEIEYQYPETRLMEVFYHQYDHIDALRYKMNPQGQIIKRELTGVGNYNDVIYFKYNSAGFLENRKAYNKEIGRIFSTYTYQFAGS
jgi:hypothetical protein